MTDQTASATVRPVDRGQLIFEQPALPYGFEALQPALSAEILHVHYGKHHAKYVATLNRLLSEQNFSAHSLAEVIRIAHGSGARGLFNNAAQAWNHSFFWESMSPQRSRPSARLTAAIAATFGSVVSLRDHFIAEGSGHFGSGWVWLVAQGESLQVMSTHDASTPILEEGITPLLTCDLWEHAYYIDYRQDRSSWLTTWWDKLANWRLADQQYEAACGHGTAWRFPQPKSASTR